MDGWRGRRLRRPRLRRRREWLRGLRRLRAAGYEISFRPDPSLYDGRYANVGWLQELPKQVTNLSWDNAALMSMGTMGDLKVEESDLVEISAGWAEADRAGADGAGTSGWRDHDSSWARPQG